MASPTNFPGDLIAVGDIICGGSYRGITRAMLTQTSNAIFPVNLANFRVWDAIQTVLPGTAAADDLGLIGTTFGTVAPTIRTSDSKAASTTQRARIFIPIPAEFQAAETVSVVISAGMTTTISDTTATVDVEAYEVLTTGALGGSPTDLCTTAATTINSVTFADATFALTSSGLIAGDLLDVRITIAIVDGATATAVIGTIVKVALVCDIQG